MRAALRLSISSWLAALACLAWSSDGCATCLASADPFLDVLRSQGAVTEREWVSKLPSEIRRVARSLPQATEQPTAPQDSPRAEPGPDIYADLDPRHRKDLESDIEFGKAVAKEVEKEMKVSGSANMTDRVNRIGQELALIANANQVEVSWGDKRLNPFRYTFTVLEGKDVNAFSIPGGFIYVYEGLLNYCETDHELAGVLAHEIAHASFRHVATLQREQSRLNAITLPLILIGLFSGGETGMGIAQAGSLTQQAIGSGWSVRAEKSADLGGFQYLRKSAYDPVGLLTFMERLAFEERAQGRVDWGIFKTHPPSRERVSALIGMLRGANLPIRRSVSSTTVRAIPVQEVDGAYSIKLLNRKVVTLRGPDAEGRAEQYSRALSAFFDKVPAQFDISARPDGAVIGQGQVLFQLTAADAERAERPLMELTESVVRTLKAAAFELQYRVWDN